ncbi:MAG: hypothetical protein K0S23_6 [Fluviicola sp.]|jgi:hypothetical protein|nr:hypothetical protein [Fluviicola sp.]
MIVGLVSIGLKIRGKPLSDFAFENQLITQFKPLLFK